MIAGNNVSQLITSIIFFSSNNWDLKAFLTETNSIR
jgi:hypothetical protein